MLSEFTKFIPAEVKLAPTEVGVVPLVINFDTSRNLILLISQPR